MTYRLPPLSKTPLAAIIALAALTSLPLRADPAPQAGISARFTTEGNMLPRRSHEVLTLESMNIERLDASILHVSEADTLRALEHPDTLPADMTEIWHSQIATRPENMPPVAGQTVKTTLDALQLVKTLQPGLYVADVHEVTTGRPRAEARKLFMISNIGLEAFAGADGLTVQARLLSEATPAQNIEIALIARNNREIVRLRTDPDGVARFGKDQISGTGDDTPAALYAYGADGEFTALPVAASNAGPAAMAIASIVTDKQTYKPGDDIRGLVLVRTPDGHAATGSQVFVQLENAEGGVAEFQISPAGASDGFSLSLHAPPANLAGKWTIRAYRNLDGKPVLLGQRAITVSAGEVSATPPAKQDTGDATNTIAISPGRRSFQRGEMANVSVQPQDDADVTVTLVDGAVRAIVRQHITKDGAVVQLPIPADAMGGMYVIATAFTAPGAGNGKDAARTMHRSFGLQWIEIDEGAKRMSVRLDTPERVEIGGKLPVSVTLPDLNGKPGKVQMVGSDVSTAVMLDPLAFFYGKRPVTVQVYDTYASVIGTHETAVPDLSAQAMLSLPVASSLLWPEPATVSKSGKADFTEVFPTLAGNDPRLRVSAIAWSDDKLGYGEATIVGVPPAKGAKKPVKATKQAALPIHSRTTTIKPDSSLTLKPGETMIASVDPIIAAPAAFDAGEPLFVTPGMPQLRDYMLGLLVPADDPALLNDAILSTGLPGQKLELPRQTTARMLDAVQTLLAKPDLSSDQAMLAHYVLLKGGRETPLEVAAWLATNPQFDGIAARAARIALAVDSPLFKTDSAALQADIEVGAGDLEAKAVTLYLLAQANQPWPAKLAHAVAEEAAKAQPTRTDLALRLAEAAHRRWGDPKLKAEGAKDASATVQASGNAVKIVNADTRTLYAWIVTGLPR